MTRKISVFIASPGDVAKERTTFRQTIDALNNGFADGAEVEFEALGWEDTLASTGRRNQSVINEEIDRCDVFILTMYRRWGQAAPDAGIYSSYTEEEFHRALERWKQRSKPEIFVFFKRVDPASEADPGVQLKKVMDFRKHLEETRQVLYHYYEDEESFAKEVDRHLRAYVKDDLPKTDKQDTVILPLDALDELEDAKTTATQKIQEAEAAKDAEQTAILKLEKMQIQMAEDAAKLSMEGQIEFARQKFSELVTETNDIGILYLGYEFYSRTGDLDAAHSVLQKWLNLSGYEEKTANTAAAYGNLGNVYKIQGDLNKAIEYYEKALEINKSIGRKEGIANQYGNLANVYKTQGDLDKAIEYYKKSLEINKSLGQKKGLAIQYGNLGIVYKIQGDLDKAVEYYEKALEINKSLDRKEGIANQYTNLGIVYATQGDLDKAIEYHEKALGIDKSLGRQEGIANQYGNLGNVYKTQGDLDKAIEYHEKSLRIEKSLGRKEGIADQYANLGIVYKVQGDLDKATQYYEKSLQINESLGRKEGIAGQYTNLGNIFKIQGDLDKARDFYEKSLKLFTELRSPNTKIVSDNIEILDDHQTNT